MKTKIKRKYLINKKFQLGTAILVVAIQVPCMLVTALGLSWLYLIYLDDRTVSSWNSCVLTEMAVVGLILTGVILFFSVRLTHTVVGPVKKTVGILRQMAQGRPPENKIRFRRADWFKDLALELNLLSDHMIKTRRSREKARESLEAMKKTLADRGDPDACIKKIDEILSVL